MVSESNPKNILGVNLLFFGKLDPFWAKEDMKIISK
jgi:hypothetical protein